MEKLVVIDSYSLIYKAYYAIREMRTSANIPTNAIYGFLNMLIKIIKEQSPDYIYAAFDAKTPTFRHEASETYKATRQKMPDELAVQIDYILKIIESLGITAIECQGYEADDLLGTYSKIAKEKHLNCVLITGDRDSFQLADDNTVIYYAKRGVTDIVKADKDYIRETYQMAPRQLIDLKALMGDKSDNISGIAGIGEKTAQKLIIDFQSLDGIYENIDKIEGKLKEKLVNGKADAVASRFLAEISKDAPIDDNLIKYEGITDEEKLFELLSLLEMKSVIAKLDIKHKESHVQEQKEDIKYCYTFIEDKNLTEIKNKIRSADKLYVYYEIIGGALSVISIKIDEDIYIIDSSNKAMFASVMSSLAENSSKIILHDFKTFIAACYEYADIKNVLFDIYLASYVLNSTDSNYSLDSLCRKYLHTDLYISNSNAQLSFLAENKISYDDICKSVSALEKLHNLFYASIKEAGCENLYYNIELPLAKVLSDMEHEGINIDTAELENAGAAFDKRIEELEANIRSICDKDKSFNINSPKQLGTLLFEELGLPAKKKTKTGYSTDIEVLELLRNAHPVIEMIIELRKASKLNSTYVKGLLALTDNKTSKIHTTFNQTITTTGRISSSEPNLQNIPIRTNEGRLLRKVFCAADENHILVDADYSQIELRVLADISGDESLIKSFINDEDIHRATAAEVFGVPLEMVTNKMRSRAKAVNFGIIYGISDYGLSRDLMISRKEAREYIDIYLQRYPGVKEYMDSIVMFARKHGYVETKFNRRRYIPKINDRNFNERSFAERTALNTPIQGTAADIIKIAMNSVYEELKRQNLKSKLILQVHDELIVHAPAQEKDIVTEILRDKMQSAADMKVPLKADICAGFSWYECK